MRSSSISSTCKFLSEKSFAIDVVAIVELVVCKGIFTENLLPFPCWLSVSILPWRRVTNFCTIDSPNPNPSSP